MISIAEALGKAESVLASSGVADARRESISLLALALGKDKTFFYSHPEYLLTTDDERIFDEYLERRASREPFQYIAGHQEFFGLDFEVTPEVLIPRPETEMIVERAIALLSGNSNASFCEIGVGSGCITVSMLVHLPSAHAVGLDISRYALDVAGRNAQRHGVSDRWELVESDLFAGLRDQRFDIIVSNPPYVPERDRAGLQTEVRDFEPRLALFAGEDGLDVIRRIVQKAPTFLRPEGYLLLEIGFDQSQNVASLFDPLVWQKPEILPDLQGIPRLVVAHLV